MITGAKGGLGTFVTKAFLEAGATVAGVSRSIESKDFDHPNFNAMPASVEDSASAGRVVESIVTKLGRLDILVHTVGAYAGGATIAETDDAAVDHMLDANLKSAFLVMRAVIPHLRSQGSGRILAIGSRAAVEPAAGSAPYNLSKAALISLIRTAALENKDRNITANIILPGTIDTPVNRSAMPGADTSTWVSPAQIAELLTYLASDSAQQINGAVIPIYGQGL